MFKFEILVVLSSAFKLFKKVFSLICFLNQKDFLMILIYRIVELK